MNSWIRFGIISALILSVAYIGFMWWAFGGLEKYQPPFEIVIPENLHGVVCATSRPGTTEDTKHVVRHEVSANGLLEVNGDILRSHRPIKLYARNNETGQLNEIPSDTLFPIYTENDSSAGQRFVVMWFGTHDEWSAFKDHSPSTTLCLGKFGKVVAK